MDADMRVGSFGIVVYIEGLGRCFYHQARRLLYDERIVTAHGTVENPAWFLSAIAFITIVASPRGFGGPGISASDGVIVNRG